MKMSVSSQREHQNQGLRLSKVNENSIWTRNENPLLFLKRILMELACILGSKSNASRIESALAFQHGALEARKTLPGRALEAPRRTQEGPKTAQHGPKMEDESKMPQHTRNLHFPPVFTHLYQTNERQTSATAEARQGSAIKPLTISLRQLDNGMLLHAPVRAY